MATQTVPYMTPEEYLETERKADHKSEYFDGSMYAKPRATPRHVRIAMNLGARLTMALRGGRCQPFNSDMRVCIPATGLYTYPDVSVVCGEPIFMDGDNLTNPVLVMEVLSKSNFLHYQSVPGLNEYLLVSQNLRSITHCTRLGPTDWRIITVGDAKGSIQLPSINVELSFAEIYAGADSRPG